MPLRASVMQWFNVGRATAMGIVMTGGAVGGFATQPFTALLVERSGSWRAGWLANAIYVVVAIVLCPLSKESQSYLARNPDRHGSGKRKVAPRTDTKAPRTYRSADTWSVDQALRSPILWWIVLVNIAFLQSLMLVISHGVLHLTDLGYTGVQAACFLSALVLCSGISRFPMGWLADRIEPRWMRSARSC